MSPNLSLSAGSQYPDAWGADGSTDSWFYSNYIGDRARLAHTIVRLCCLPCASERTMLLKAHSGDHVCRAGLASSKAACPSVSVLISCLPRSPGSLQAGKPIIMEECGSQTFYGNRDFVRVLLPRMRSSLQPCGSQS